MATYLKRLLSEVSLQHRQLTFRIPNRLVIKRHFLVSSQKAAIDMGSKDGELRVFIVAGEVSGDMIGSRFMDSLKKLSPCPVRFAGVGGLAMSKQGLDSQFPMEDIAVMGIWELVPHLSKLRVKLKQTVQSALSFQPHVVLTVDSKGFSFRFLKQLRAIYGQQGLVGPLHFHYVAPSFWAWKGGEERLKGLSKFVDHVFCILPFEAEVCISKGLNATFVGHPTLEDVLELEVKDSICNEWKIQGTGETFKEQHGISSGTTVISLLPGSRLQEVTRMLSIFSNTMELLKDSHSELTAAIHVAPNKYVEDYIRKAVCEWPTSVVLVPSGSPQIKYDAFSASRVALCTSGTVAVELQLARLPCVVAYRAHLLTEWLIRFKAKVPYISLPNIILDSAIIPEALFNECTPSKLASLLKNLTDDENLRRKQICAAEKVFDLLVPPRVSCIQIQQERSRPILVDDYRPSMIAASTVLHYRRI
ncbi:unnamed protein product [Fraxinus pennsylvanica]|uniref:lipid-A-disaccharide synthase n=1 Tax=Fraxinus pennsylvanica TaxID=56036 RepID=A0AAD1ZS03_9LAMI|nr:unnamed protein product [Fraxinus pennsylvanica]